MKIGILTYHRAHNYGALLQAVALRLALIDMGNDVYFVDYWPKYHERKYMLFSWYVFTHSGKKGAWLYLKDRFLSFHDRMKRIAHFRKFIKEHIEPHCLGTNETFDLLIYGSDQIWRKQHQTKNYNSTYFGVNNIKAKRNISYAASIDNLPKSEKDKNTFFQLVSHLDKVSVRETPLLDLLKVNGFNKAVLSLDPTLLISSALWRNEIKEERLIIEPYLLYYNLLENSFDDSDIVNYAKERGLRLVTIYGAAVPNADSNFTTCGPDVFLNLIRFADFIITSSFHGLAFSLIFQKQFYSAFKIRPLRGESLLKSLNLSNRLLKPGSKIPRDQEKIDYSQVNAMLDEIRKNSIEYLKQSTK